MLKDDVETLDTTTTIITTITTKLETTSIQPNTQISTLTTEDAGEGERAAHSLPLNLLIILHYAPPASRISRR